jgi:N-acyl-D-aspartate/D-glutamate deacylase
VLADFVLENECRPGLVAAGISNADVDGVARALADPRVLISSSDAGAHAQVMCSSGDTTLLLSRHVRDRDDFTLEDAVYQLTGRQADGFALEELTYGGDEFVHDAPQGAPVCAGRRVATTPRS